MAGFSIALPNISDSDFDSAKQIKQIKSYLATLTEQLKYMFNNLDVDNLTGETALKINAIVGMSQIMKETNSALETRITNATKLLTTALGGYVVKRDGEILIMDTEVIETATKVWRWNLNGLGYSASGADGPYELAITMDGAISAKFITTGILTSVVIMSDNYAVDESGNTVYGTMINLNNGSISTPSFNLNGVTGEAEVKGKIIATEGSIAGMDITGNGLSKTYNKGTDTFTGTLSLGDDGAFNLFVKNIANNLNCGVNVYYNSSNEPVLNLYARNTSGLDNSNILLNGSPVLVRLANAESRLTNAESRLADSESRLDYIEEFLNI